MRMRSLVFLLLSCIFAVHALRAQQTLGAVTGTVTDTSGAVIPGAQITVTSEQTGLTRTQTANGDGAYIFSGLQIGSYKLTVVSPGFQTDQHPAVAVQGDRTTTLDIRMIAGAVSSTVTVTSTPTLNKTDTTNGYVLEAAQIAQIPLGTGSFTQLAVLTPGVNADFLTGAGSNDGLGNQAIFSNGQRDTSNSFSFNGVNTNNLFNGSSTSAVAANRFVLSTGESFGVGGAIQTNSWVYDAIGEALPSAPPEFLQELRVNAANYDASQGANSGAHIEQVVKSGGNDWHGQVYGYRHTDWLDAAPFFRKQDPAVAAIGQHYVPQLHRFTVGGLLGGPAIKDKLFFFAAYQYERVSDQANGTAESTVPQGLTDDRSVAGIIAAENAFENESGSGATPLTPGQLDPAAVKLLQYKLPGGQYLIPSSNSDGSSGFNALVAGPASLFRADRAAMSVDWNLNAKDVLTGRYFYQHDPSSTPFTSQASTLGFPQALESGSHVGSIINTATLSPHLVYDQRIGYIREDAFATTSQQVTPSAAGINLLGFQKFSRNYHQHRGQ
ncbi:MAG TPA: carboxypeptidase-like regulatory domain-containing protein [Acidisarcina sp.]